MTPFQAEVVRVWLVWMWVGAQMVAAGLLIGGAVKGIETLYYRLRPGTPRLVARVALTAAAIALLFLALAAGIVAIDAQDNPGKYRTPAEAQQ